MTGEREWVRLRALLGRPLHQLMPYDAAAVALELGSLAPWCLRPEVLHLAAEDDAIPLETRAAWRVRPQLRMIHGASWVVFATAPGQGLPLLRDAFVVPLQWVAAMPHDRCLPPSLRDLADNLPRNLGLTDTWGLRWAPELSHLDARRIPWKCESGWASLAAGLLVAALGGMPNPGVWASGCWRWPGGIERVDHLPAKLRLAVEYGATRFFVPDVQCDKAREITAGTGLEVGSLRSATGDPRVAMADYLWALEVPPQLTDQPESFDRCRSYYVRIPSERRAEGDEFYRRQLLSRLANNLRQKVHDSWPSWSPSHLVTVVSGSHNLPRLTAQALRIRHCLLLHTPDDKHRQLAEALEAEFEAEGIRCRLVPVAFAEPAEHALRTWLAEWLRGVPAEKVVFDVTPGTKLMSITLARCAPPRSWLFYIAHTQGDDRRAQPGSERPQLWQAE